jgi:hypothetical protein
MPALVGARSRLRDRREHSFPRHQVSLLFAAAALLLRRARGGRSDDSVELGLRSRIAVDRYMRGDIKLQPLDVIVEHN